MTQHDKYTSFFIFSTIIQINLSLPLHWTNKEKKNKSKFKALSSFYIYYLNNPELQIKVTNYKLKSVQIIRRSPL